MMVSYVCLAATAAALTRSHIIVEPKTHRVAGTIAQCKYRVSHRRSTTAFAQLAPGWMTAVDQASGQTYYINEQTGHSQWEPPQAAMPYGYGSPHEGHNARHASAQVIWWLAPASGVLNEYIVRNGEEQVLGRYDMVEQNPYVSRAQCLVRVAADGTASVLSIGKAQTFIVKGPRSFLVLRKDQTHVLKHGEQIALRKDPRSGSMLAVFTVYAQQGDFAQGDAFAQQLQPSGYGQQQPNSYGQQQPSSYGQQQPNSYGQQQPNSYGQQHPSRQHGYLQ